MINPANIVTALIEAGLDLRHVTFSDDWYPAAPVRFECELFGVSALVELCAPTLEGTQWVYWCLNPKSADVSVSDFWKPKVARWPGDVWGTAMIDRRIGFSVDADFPIRARRNMRGILSRFPERSTDDLRLPIDWAA